MEDAELKINLHSPMNGALNANQKWSNNCDNPMHPYRVSAM